MPRSDDLVPLLAPSGGAHVGFRQGVVVSFNQETAENIIRVGDTLLTNLAILNTSEAALLEPGHVVSILTSGSTWGILGRFTIPGSPEAASALKAVTNRIHAASDASTGIRNSSTYGDLTGPDPGPSITVNVGLGGRALVFWSCEIGQALETGTSIIDFPTENNPHVGIQVSGATTIAPNDGVALNSHIQLPTSGFPGHATLSHWMQAAMMHLYEGLNPGSTTFTMKYRSDGIVPTADVVFESREIALFLL